MSGPIFAAGPSSVTWTQLRFGPEHNGFNPQESALSPSTVSGLKLAWSTTGTYTDPVVAGGLDIAAGWPIPGNPHVTIFARNASTGALVWSAPYQTYQPIDPAVGDSGSLVLVVADGPKPKLKALKITDGTLAWSFPLPAGIIYSAPTVAGDLLFLSGQNGQVLALNGSTGAEVWSVQLPTPVVSAAPVDINGMLYVDGMNQRVYAIGAGKGIAKWATKPLFKSSKVAVGATLAGVKGRLFVGASNDLLYALRAGTGRVEWKFGSAVASGNLSLAVAYKTVYVTGFANGPHGENPLLYALNGSNGKKRWTYSTDNANNPSVANGVVYLTNLDGLLMGIDAHTGKSLWTYKAGLSAADFTYPAIANGMVYVNAYAFGLPAA